MQTYKTRVLTAQDNRLVDALERDPRYRKLAAVLRPPAPKATPAKTPPKAKAEVEEFDEDDREPPKAVAKPTPRKAD